jgi:hypothetical protein
LKVENGDKRILHSPFSILHSPFSILHSPFSILQSPVIPSGAERSRGISRDDPQSFQNALRLVGDFSTPRTRPSCAPVEMTGYLQIIHHSFYSKFNTQNSKFKGASQLSILHSPFNKVAQ